jgi:hypothetical protein
MPYPSFGNCVGYFPEVGLDLGFFPVALIVVPVMASADLNAGVHSAFAAARIKKRTPAMA